MNNSNETITYEFHTKPKPLKYEYLVIESILAKDLDSVIYKLNLGGYFIASILETRIGLTTQYSYDVMGGRLKKVIETPFAVSK